MDISVRDDSDIKIIVVSGELDAETGPELTDVLDPLVSEGNLKFVIDLEGVSFIGSAGLATLVRCFKHVRSASGNVYLAGLQPPVQRVFELTRLDRVSE